MRRSPPRRIHTCRLKRSARPSPGQSSPARSKTRGSPLGGVAVTSLAKERARAIPGGPRVRGRRDLSGRGVLAVRAEPPEFLHTRWQRRGSRRAGEGCLASLMDVKGTPRGLVRVLGGEGRGAAGAARDADRSGRGGFVHYRSGRRPLAERPPACSPSSAPKPGAARRPGPRAARRGSGDHALRSWTGGEACLVRASDLPGPGSCSTPPPGRPRHPRGPGRGGAHSWSPRSWRPAGGAGRPWDGPDVTGANLLHETGLLAQYHSDQGLLRGPGVVARLEARGRERPKRCGGSGSRPPPRRGPPSSRAAARWDASRRGRVAAPGPVALAYVHRDTPSRGARWRWAGRRPPSRSCPSGLRSACVDWPSEDIPPGPETGERRAASTARWWPRTTCG